MQTDIVSSQRQKVLRRIILLGTPLILGVLELGHPLLDRVNPIKMLAPFRCGGLFYTCYLSLSSH